jgi:uncharacterized protein YecT (DUF1311 family)
MRQTSIIPGVFGAVLFLVLATATAQDVEEACDGTTYDTAVCLIRKYKKIDTELNGAYQKALKETAFNYGPEDVENLKDAQRKWIVYRDAACKAEYALWGGGSGGPAAHTICLTKLTKERLGDLKEVYLDMSK